jgi:hypothetical protein
LNVLLVTLSNKNGNKLQSLCTHCFHVSGRFETEANSSKSVPSCIGACVLNLSPVLGAVPGLHKNYLNKSCVFYECLKPYISQWEPTYVNCC